MRAKNRSCDNAAGPEENRRRPCAMRPFRRPWRLSARPADSIDARIDRAAKQTSTRWFVALIEFSRSLDLVEQRLRHRLTGLVMFREVLQHFRPGRPHLVYLRRVLNEIARHTRSAKPRIFHV